MVYPTRMAMNQWLPGRKDRHKLLRKVVLLVIILSFMLVIAMIWYAPTPCPAQRMLPHVAGIASLPMMLVSLPRDT